MKKKIAIVLASLFAVLLVFFMPWDYFFYTSRSTLLTPTLNEFSGEWLEPKGIGGVGTMTIDSGSMTLKYGFLDTPLSISRVTNKNGWVKLDLRNPADESETSLRLKRIGKNRIRCVDEYGESGQIRVRRPGSN